MAELVHIPCFCRGDNPSCVICSGSGQVPRQACGRCTGSGFEASSDRACLDCRGRGYRELDNPILGGE